MPDRSPLEIIDRFAKAVEEHPNALPFSREERDALEWLVAFRNVGNEERAALDWLVTARRRMEVLAWAWKWGAWAAVIVVMAITQWDRISATLEAVAHVWLKK